MPKVKISEYSTVNSNNTDINSINIDEGCAPSGINNAIREVMVHLKNWQTNASGDGATFASLVVQGTGSFTGAVTMSAGATLSGTNTLSGSTVMAASAGTSASPSIYFSGDTNTGIFSPAADTIAFAEGGAEAMRIDSSGNVGIGVTPSAWAASYKAIQLTDGVSLSEGGGNTYLGNNWVYDGASKYIANGTAAVYGQSGGQHIWYTAPSGTAGNTITFTTILQANRGQTLALEGASLQNGTGITFPATQSASSDANTLDDYEEGTWTPTLLFGGSSTGITYAGGREGRYTKVGRIVTVAFYFQLTNKGSASGNATISNLPFVPYNQGGAYPFYVGTLVGESGMSSMPTGTYCLGWNDSNLYLRSNSATTWTPLTSASNFNNNSTLYGTITYEVT